MAHAWTCAVLARSISCILFCYDCEGVAGKKEGGDETWTNNVLVSILWDIVQYICV